MTTNNETFSLDLPADRRGDVAAGHFQAPAMSAVQATPAQTHTALQVRHLG